MTNQINNSNKIEICIIKERCKGCGICVEVCLADVLELSEELNSRGYPTPCVKKQEECLNCGMCEMFCAEFAIWASNKEGVVGT